MPGDTSLTCPREDAVRMPLAGFVWGLQWHEPILYGMIRGSAIHRPGALKA